MTLADPRPKRRIVNKGVYTEFHALALVCLCCGRARPNAAHILDRGRGGDDCLENFMPLCGSGTSGCHGALHGTPYTDRRLRITGEIVRRGVGFWLASEDGAAARAYLISKLGKRSAAAYMARHFGIRK